AENPHTCCVSSYFPGATPTPSTANVVGVPGTGLPPSSYPDPTAGRVTVIVSPAVKLMRSSGTSPSEATRATQTGNRHRTGTDATSPCPPQPTTENHSMFQTRTRWNGRTGLPSPEPATHPPKSAPARTRGQPSAPSHASQHPAPGRGYTQGDR